MAEIELNVISGQCLNRRIDEIVKKEVISWQKFRNNKNTKVNWQFRTKDARIKLSKLYPTLESWHYTNIYSNIFQTINNNYPKKVAGSNTGVTPPLGRITGAFIVLVSSHIFNSDR